MGIIRRPLVVEYKDASAATGTQTGTVTPDADDPMVFTVLASVTGVLDEVKDVVLPGAFERTLRKRRPKVIKDHDWGQRLGTVESIKELRPGDPALPEKLPNGEPWPAVAGALIGRVRLFTSPEGKQAAERWRQDTEQQFSIGYIARKALLRKADKARLLADMDLLELSDVLWGAMPLCGVLPGQLAGKMLPPPVEGKAAPDVAVEELDEGAEEGEEQAALDRLAADPVRWELADDPQDQGDHGGDSGEDDSGDDPPEVEAARRSLIDAQQAAADTAVSGAQRVADAQQALARARAAAPPVPPGLARVVLAPEGLVAEDAEGKRAMSTAKREKVPTLPGSDTRFPIEKPEDVTAAVRAYGRAKPEDKPRVKAWIIRRARELGATDRLPEAWRTTGKALEDEPPVTPLLTLDDEGFLVVQGKAESPVPHPGDAAALKRWYVTGEGAAKIRWGTPGDLTRCHKLAQKHMTPDQAWGFCQNRHKDALGTSNSPTKALVTPETYDASEAKAAYDPTLERGELAGHLEARPARLVLDVKDYPRFPGTLEERLEAIRAAVSKRLLGPPLPPEEQPTEGSARLDGVRHYWSHVMLDATWTDRVIATRVRWDADTDERQSFELAYTWDGETVTLGQPVPIRLQVTATALAGENAPLYEAPDVVAAVVSVKDVAARLTRTGRLQAKVGRVLSAANATLLRDAMQHLLAVAAKAGIELVPTGTAKLPEQEEPRTDRSTTAPSAQGTEVKVLPVAELEETLARFAVAADSPR